MAEYLKLGRVYFVLLAIVTVGRFVMGNVKGVPYREGSDKMSIVIVTIVATILYAAFARAFLGYRMWEAAKLTMTLGLVSQVVILLATALSYLVGIESYFNHPTALSQHPPVPVGLGMAMGIRAMGLVSNTLACGITGAVGWGLGALLPPRADPKAT
jgi:membrane protease YdiL (CAAX protease family)